MKVTLPQPILSQAITKGGASAFTAEGQSEEQKASNVTKSCICIRADAESVMFESAVTKMASRHVVKASKDVVVADPGEVCVPAKELKDLCSKLKETQSVVLEFIPSASKDKAASPYGVQSDGNIDFRVNEGDITVVQAAIESYPSSKFQRAQFKQLPVVLKGKNKLFKDACGMVTFAINPADYSELLNNIGIFVSDDTIRFVGTDKKRCAIANVDRKDVETVGFDSLLLEAEFLSKGQGLFGDDDDVSFANEPGASHVTMYSGDTCVRLDTLDPIRKAKYPDYRKVIKMGTKVKINVDKMSLEFSLKAIALANKDRGVYTIKQGDASIQMRAKGVTAVRNIEAKAKCDKIAEALGSDTVCFNTQALMSCVERLSGDKVTISFTADEMRAKVESVGNPNFIYLMQRIPDDEM